MDDLSLARQFSDRLFEIVHPDFLYQRPLRERHRIVFYLGHLDAFDWNLMRPHLLGLESFDERLDRLFAFGIDPIAGQGPSDQPSDWPRLYEVLRYRQEIRLRLDDALEVMQLPEGLLQMALEHRWMHVETLSYMFHQLEVEHKVAQPQPEIFVGEAPEHGWVAIPAGVAKLGLCLGLAGGTGFGWDNEFDAHSVEVDAFRISRYKVTNEQYLAFVGEGGYQRNEFWSADDWAWIERENVKHPAFWLRKEGAWLWRGIFEHLPLPAHWPVYVSHAEASAYARWAGMRLPTEAEFHRAAYAEGDPYPWGGAAPSASFGYFGLERWDPFAVNAFPQAQSRFGVQGLVAGGWEWTSSLFSGFAGFRASTDYPGYSADFFDGRHYVLKGGSTRTAESMLRASFRNWFQPHYPYVYSGFRCVEGRD